MISYLHHVKVPKKGFNIIDTMRNHLHFPCWDSMLYEKAFAT